MKIEFLGAARTVTGSCYIVKDEDFTIMVDCGMFQGKNELKTRNFLPLIHTPTKIDALIVTHAHIDHSGLIPNLVKKGFYGNIYCTRATADLCSVMLPDSAHIQEMDTRFMNKRNRQMGREEIPPLYTVEDAENCMKNFVPVSYGEIIDIHPRIQIRFRDAGHILGSAFVEMWIDEGGKKKKIVFSGDIGPGHQALIRDPEIVEDADVLLVESTYGNRLHKSKEDTYAEFRDIIEQIRKTGGNIVIPAFAIERTQEIIYTLDKLFKNGEIPPLDVYIDSPLAISATEIFKKNADCFDEETRKLIMSGDNPLEFPSLRYIQSSEESKRLNDEAKGAIIISASGMCTAGRIKYHLLNNLYRPDSSIVFVGYQAEGTLGRRIVDGAKQVHILGDDVAVRANIFTLGGFSGHADSEGILNWISHIKNPKLVVFVTHGEEESARALSEKLHSRFGYTAFVPRWGEIVDVETLESEMAPYGITDSYTPADHELENISNLLTLLSDKYRHAKEEKRTLDLRKLQEDMNDAKEMLAFIIDKL